MRFGAVFWVALVALLAIACPLVDVEAGPSPACAVQLVAVVDVVDALLAPPLAEACRAQIDGGPRTCECALVTYRNALTATEATAPTRGEEAVRTGVNAPAQLTRLRRRS